MRFFKNVLKVSAVFISALLIILFGAGFYIKSYFSPVPKKEIILTPGKGYIEGTVCKPKGLIPFTLPGIKGAKVSVSPGGNFTYTDEKGYFLLNDLDQGFYSINIKAQDYEETIKKVIMVSSGSGSLIQIALFPEPEGPPVAHIETSSPLPWKKPPETFSYNKNINISADKSKNVSYKGFYWEIRNEKGEVLLNPYKNPKEPLQLEPSPAFGASPYTFIFNPPYPEKFTIKLILSNPLYPGSKSESEISINAVNTKPEAIPSVIAGPEPPGKIPFKDLRDSSGLSIVPVGSAVYLKGFSIDENFSSPEMYNPGGTSPDIYGKNHDHFQRRFSWRWKLKYASSYDEEGKDPLSDVTNLFLDKEGKKGETTQYPHFTPLKPGKYIAILVVNDSDLYGSLESEPASVTILAVEKKSADKKECSNCHEEQVRNYSLTLHGREGVECESCHGPSVLHLKAKKEDKKKTINISLESGVCGQCHEQYNEWEKSRHSDAESYGFTEIAKPLLVNCYKCHYAKSYAQSIEKVEAERISFHELQYKKRLMSIGPLMPDLSKLPEKNEPRITCQACHNSHPVSNKSPYGLRLAGKENICSTCHYEKWQNSVLEGFAGEIKNGYEYPSENYDFVNPHNTKKKCFLCHMDRNIATADRNGVRAVGGHTLRMRDAGENNILGGFGPRYEDPAKERYGDDKDDTLNLSPCQECHHRLKTFNRNNFQKSVYEKWIKLGELLRSLNDGKLPSFKPGDKCAICHRGGTLPFENDPELILENAYTNYKLIKNDRSWGIHNPKYVMKLLDDSISSIERNYKEKLKKAG